MEIDGLTLIADVYDIVVEIRNTLQLTNTGIELLRDIKLSGNDVMCTCPFHKDGQESKPSCGISLVKKRRGAKVFNEGTVHCFTCDYTASFTEFISNCFGYTDGGLFGYKWLTKNFVTLEVEKRQPIPLAFNEQEIQETTIINYITEEELDSYRFIHPYMYTRKLTDKVINYFDIGFDSATNCMTMPVRDLEGRVPFVYRRSVQSKFFNNAKDTPRGNYIYGLYEVYKNIDKINELIICESPIDALSAWCHNRYAVALFTCHPTPVQIKLLSDLPIRKFVNGFDKDDAGNHGIKKLKRLLPTKIYYNLITPEYADDLNKINPEDWDTVKTSLI